MNSRKKIYIVRVILTFLEKIIQTMQMVNTMVLTTMSMIPCHIGECVKVF